VKAEGNLFGVVYALYQQRISYFQQAIRDRAVNLFI